MTYLLGNVGSDLAVPVIAGVLALIGSYAGSRFEIRKLRQQRYLEREKSFEVAQVGYRACYRKFLANVAALRGTGVGVPLQGQDEVNAATLRDNYWEACFCGDPIVVQELESYWPLEQQEQGRAPPRTPPSSLIQAMRAHGTRSLDAQLELKKEKAKR